MGVINKHGIEKKVSIVIPALNEVNIKEVFAHIPEFIDEIVVVDGESIDGAREEIKKFRSDAKNVLEKPSGKGAALKTGFENASGGLVIMMEADGSHDPRASWNQY